MVKVLRDFLYTDLTSRDQCPFILSTGEKREHKQCETRTAKLLFANKTERDIWWKEELGQVAKTESKR